MLCAVLLDFCIDAQQVVSVCHVDWILDDDLLSVDMAFSANPQHIKQNLLIEVNVEYDRVIIGFIGEEDGDRSQHACSQHLSKPYSPVVVTSHLHASVLEDIIDDKYQYGDDDGYTQSALPDNGSQGAPMKKKIRQESDSVTLLIASIMWRRSFLFKASE